MSYDQDDPPQLWTAAKGQRTFHVQPISLLGYVILIVLLTTSVGFGWTMLFIVLAVLVIEVGTAFPVRIR